jgi:hypothetical protein
MFALLEHAIMDRLAEDQATLTAVQSELQTELPLEVVTAANAANAAEDNALSARASDLQAQIDSLNARVAENQTTIATAKAIIVADEAAIVRELESPNFDPAAIASLEAQVEQSRTEIATSTTAIETLESQVTGISDTLGAVHTTQALRVTNHTPGDIAVVAGLATVVGVMAKTLWNLKTKVDTCVMDTCDTNSPNYYKKLLEAWLAGLSDAAMIGYVATAIGDPVGFANAQAPGFEGVDTEAVNLLNTILGL